VKNGGLSSVGIKLIISEQKAYIVMLWESTTTSCTKFESIKIRNCNWFSILLILKIN